MWSARIPKEGNKILGSVQDISCKVVGIYASHEELGVEKRSQCVVFINYLIGFWLPGGRFWRWPLQQPRYRDQMYRVVPRGRAARRARARRWGSQRCTWQDWTVLLFRCCCIKENSWRSSKLRNGIITIHKLDRLPGQQPHST